MTSSGAGAKSPKPGRLGKRIGKWGKNESKIMWECYIRSITTLRTDYIKRMHQHGLTCKSCNCGSVETNPTSENNKLLASAAFLVAEMLGVKTRPRSGKCANEPY